MLCHQVQFQRFRNPLLAVVIFTIAPVLAQPQVSESGTVPRPELVLQSIHTGVVASVAFSPRGNLLASLSYDGTLKLWGFPEGHLLQTVDAFRNSRSKNSTNVAFSADGKAVVVTDFSGVKSFGFGEPNRFFRQTGIVEGGTGDRSAWPVDRCCR
jgi:WD40 repeat protein